MADNSFTRIKGDGKVSIIHEVTFCSMQVLWHRTVRDCQPNVRILSEAPKTETVTPFVLTAQIVSKVDISYWHIEGFGKVISVTRFNSQATENFSALVMSVRNLQHLVRGIIIEDISLSERPENIKEDFNDNVGDVWQTSVMKKRHGIIRYFDSKGMNF